MNAQVVISSCRKWKIELKSPKTYALLLIQGCALGRIGVFAGLILAPQLYI